MTLWQWLRRTFVGPERHGTDRVKERLTNRQESVADRLAEMKGMTRDQVLAEAYRRADRITRK